MKNTSILPVAAAQFVRAALFLSLTLLLGAAQAQERVVRAYAQLDTNVMLIGDKNTVHFNLEFGDRDRVVSVTPSEPLDSLANFEVLDSSRWKSGSRRPGLQRDMQFTVWDSGLYRIPSVIFTITNSNGGLETVATQPLVLTVNNPAGIDQMAAPEPIKDIVREERTLNDWLPWVLALVGGIAFAAAAWWLFNRWRQPKTALQNAVVVKRPPHEVALEKLLSLKNGTLLQEGKIKEYYSELSYILREYLENSLSMPALESTTDELMVVLNRKMVSENVIEQTQDILQTADLAKFAKVEPPVELHGRLWQATFNIVEETKPRPAVVETENPKPAAS